MKLKKAFAVAKASSERQRTSKPSKHRILMFDLPENSPYLEDNCNGADKKQIILMVDRYGEILLRKVF